MPRTTVILIRHAEKLPWTMGEAPSKQIKAAYVDNHVLSAKGYERAHALVGYFKYREEIVDIINERPLGAIIAQAVDVEKGWGKSHRPKETVEPLVTDLSLPLELYAKSQQATVIESILSGKYDDKTVLVSWSHQHLRDLVKALGVPYKQVPIWDKKRFDITWIVDFDRDGGVHFRQLAQRLLYGDGDTIMDLDVS